MNDKREEDPNDLGKIVEGDSDAGNVMIRAGYLRGLATKATGEDRLFLLRASRSLRAYANLLLAAYGKQA
jgi:hypothetical protein